MQGLTDLLKYYEQTPETTNTAAAKKAIKEILRNEVNKNEN